MSEEAKRRRWLWPLAVLVTGILLYFLSSKEEAALTEISSTPITKPRPDTQVLVMEEETYPEEEDEPSAQVQLLPDTATLIGLRAQAKSHLASLYTAQKAFYAEHGRYTSDLVFLGWTPNQAAMDFRVGFLEEFRPTKPIEQDGTVEDPSRMDADEFVGAPLPESTERIHYTAMAEKLKLADYAKFCKKGCKAGAHGFEILLVLPLGTSGKVDVWAITHDKEMFQRWDGARGTTP